MISLTKTAAQQLAKHSINVNSVRPGVTRTALSDANLRVRAQQGGVTLEDMEHRRVAAIPLKRANDPEDIASMVVFLASSKARNITGQFFNVDGGLIPDQVLRYGTPSDGDESADTGHHHPQQEPGRCYIYMRHPPPSYRPDH